MWREGLSTLGDDDVLVERRASARRTIGLLGGLKPAAPQRRGGLGYGNHAVISIERDDGGLVRERLSIVHDSPGDDADDVARAHVRGDDLAVVSDLGERRDA